MARTLSKPRPEALQREEKRTRATPIQVVVADDHAVVRAGIIGNLELQRELKVVAEASDGVEALALIKKHVPDIAVLDLRMPRMDGLDVIREVSALKLKTKVIVMTTFENQEDIQNAMKAGARAYLLKDCPREALLEAIRRVYAGEVYLLPQIAQLLIERMQKPQLSPRELEVLSTLASGKSNKEIGVQLHITEGTVKTHVESLLLKLGVASRTLAIREAVRLGLVRMSV
jgi:two-component system NarL family response regulator